MSIWESIKVALEAIRAHKFRSSLTTLGVIIGVATVIAMMGVVGGVNAQVNRELGRIGASTFYVSKMPAIVISGTQWRDYAKRKDLLIEDAEAIKRACPDVSLVGPSLSLWGLRARGGVGQTDPNVSLAGITETYGEINNISIEIGRNLTAGDVDAARRVAIVGPDVAEKLFPNRPALGEQVTIFGGGYTIVGIAERQGEIFGQSQDMYVAVPISTLQRKVGRRHSDFTISVRAVSGERVNSAMDQVRGIMRARRKVPWGEPDDFEILTRDSIMTTWRALTGSVFAAAIGIAAISLLVGGIGIMNIMMVSVKERTKEIGIRKALGASQATVLMQFLIEAMSLSALGGVLGVILSVGGLKLAAHYYPSLPVHISLGPILLSFFFSLGVGLFFGVWPAYRAAHQDPIEALRYE
ncbi:MAG: ABC transporter permease [Candidatus Alcyoniella australis]|nr:ABC transporter permease [Candidatus Alcyoniella australis]